MKLTNVIKNCISDPKMIQKYYLVSPLSRRMSDEAFIKKSYEVQTGNKLDLEHPVTFNEKLQWLKLHDRKEIYHTMVDKYAARKYVADKIGDEYLIPLLGVWDSFDEIDFDALPDEFVLKPTHTSGDYFICTDKSKIDKAALRSEVSSWLKKDYYMSHREWVYKDVKPRLIAEKFMRDFSGDGLVDYKIFCFSGEPKLLYIFYGRGDESKTGVSYYDMDFKLMPIERTDFGLVKDEVKTPENFGKMKELAETLSQGHSFLRVDLYNVDGKIYFSELTFYPTSGFSLFKTREMDKLIGDMLTLPEN